MFLLDASALLAARRLHTAAAMERFLRAQPEGTLFLSVITLGELERAAEAEANAALATDIRIWVDHTVSLFSDRILEISAADARLWGRLTLAADAGGSALMVAAQALLLGATVVTTRPEDYAGTGATLFNPADP